HAALRGRDDLTHDGGHRRDGTATQVVAVGEAAGDHHGVDALEVGVVVPQGDGLGPGPGDGTGGVDVVERSGEGDDADPCGHEAASAVSTRTTFQSSITVLASSDEAISSSSASDTPSATSSSNRLPCRTSVTPPWPRRPSARWMA